MFRCPSCSEKGIGYWAKLWCGSASPAECKQCGSLSYVHTKYRHGMQSAWPTVVKVLGLVIVFALVSVTNYIWLLLLMPVIWLVCSLWELAILPMCSISPTETKERKKFSNIFMFVLVLVVVLIYVQTTL